MKGFVSVSNLQHRLENEAMRRKNSKAFDVYADAATGKLIPVMYKSDNITGLTSVPDVAFRGDLGEYVTHISVNDALEVFGKNATQVLLSMSKVKDRRELNELLTLK